MPGKRVTPLSEEIDRRIYIIGMTRADFAKRIGITYSYLGLILQGRSTPTIDISKRIAKALKMKASEVRELALKKAI